MTQQILWVREVLGAQETRVQAARSQAAGRLVQVFGGVDPRGKHVQVCDNSVVVSPLFMGSIG